MPVPVNKKYFTEEERSAAMRASRGRWREANRERKRAQDRASEARHREPRRVNGRLRYRAHSGDRMAKARAWAMANPEAVRLHKAKYNDGQHAATMFFAAHGLAAKIDAGALAQQTET